MKMSLLELARVAAGSGPLPVMARQGGLQLSTGAAFLAAGYRF